MDSLLDAFYGSLLKGSKPSLVNSGCSKGLSNGFLLAEVKFGEFPAGAGAGSTFTADTKQTPKVRKPCLHSKSLAEAEVFPAYSAKKPQFEQRLKARVITGSKLFLLEIRSKDHGRAEREAMTYVRERLAYEKTPQYEADKLKHANATFVSMEVENAWAKQNGWGNLLNGPYLSTRLVVFPWDTIDDVTVSPKNGSDSDVVAVTFLGGAPACYDSTKIDTGYNSAKLGKDDYADQVSKLPDFTGGAGQRRKVLLHFQKETEAKAFADGLRGHVTEQEISRQIKQEEKQEREDQKAAKALQKKAEKEQEKAAASTEVVRKKPTAAFVDAEKFVTNYELWVKNNKSGVETATLTNASICCNKKIPASALRSIKRWKLSNGDQDGVFGTEADWKAYFNARDHCEKRLFTHDAYARSDYLRGPPCKSERVLFIDENGKEVTEDEAFPEDQREEGTSVAKKFLQDCRREAVKALVSGTVKGKAGTWGLITADEAAGGVASALFLHKIDFDAPHDRDGFGIGDRTDYVKATLRWFSAVATPCVIDIDLCFHERGDFAFIQAARAFGREIQADVSNYCAPKQESAAAATGSKKKGPKTSAVKSITLFEAEMELKYDKYLKEEIDDMVEKLCSPMKDAVGLLDSIIGAGRVVSVRKALSALLRAGGCRSYKAKDYIWDPVELLHYKQKCGKNDAETDTEDTTKAVDDAFKKHKQNDEKNNAASTFSSGGMNTKAKGRKKAAGGERTSAIASRAVAAAGCGGGGGGGSSSSYSKRCGADMGAAADAFGNGSIAGSAPKRQRVAGLEDERSCASAK